MVTSSACILDELFVVSKVLMKGVRLESAAIVSKEGLRDDTRITTERFIRLESGQSLRSIEMALKFNVDVTGGMVDEEATTTIVILVVGVTTTTDHATASCRDEVINRDSLPRLEIIGRQDSLTVLDDMTR